LLVQKDYWSLIRLLSLSFFEFKMTMNFRSSPLDLTTGPVIVGILLSVFLYGVATVQAYIYLRGKRTDARWLKLLVSVVELVILRG
jgi:hypothetical protein